MAGRKKKEEKRITVEQLNEEIRKKANEIYLERVKTNKKGDELSDWLTAEKIVKEKYGIK